MPDSFDWICANHNNTFLWKFGKIFNENVKMYIYMHGISPCMIGLLICLQRKEVLEMDKNLKKVLRNLKLVGFFWRLWESRWWKNVICSMHLVWMDLLWFWGLWVLEVFGSNLSLWVCFELRNVICSMHLVWMCLLWFWGLWVLEVFGSILSFC